MNLRVMSRGAGTRSALDFSQGQLRKRRFPSTQARGDSPCQSRTPAFSPGFMEPMEGMSRPLQFSPSVSGCRSAVTAP